MDTFSLYSSDAWGDRRKTYIWQRLFSPGYRVQLMMGNVLRARRPCMQDLSATAGLELNEMLKSLAGA